MCDGRDRGRVREREKGVRNKERERLGEIRRGWGNRMEVARGGDIRRGKDGGNKEKDGEIRR